MNIRKDFIMDKITESMVEAFKTSTGITFSNESLEFEYFVNDCVIYNEYGAADFDLDDITTGDSTQGIDGIAIIVNKKLVSSTDEIDTLIYYNQEIAVKFVLIQTKTSTHFENGEINNMLSFSKMFFSDDNSAFKTPQMQKFIELKEYIFSKGDKLKKNPELVMYYVTLGTWNNKDKNLKSIIKAGEKELKNTNLFSNTKFIPCGSDEIQNLYRKTKSKLKTTFDFEKRITMYSINDDEVGYSGVLPFKEFKKLIVDENGAVKPVFEDNIRDYLGPNPDVNKRIKQTIIEGDVNAFSRLNNGIMIVASSIKISGDRATIEDYQIVNGCQTSNVLIECMYDAEKIDNLIIPVRVIATKDENIKNSITKATNSQTGIKPEQLEALSTFHKQLEEYYKTFAGEGALVYERRTGQYRDSDIPKNKIVTISLQIKAVAAMFLDQPSEVSGQYGTVAKRVGQKIFKPKDKLIIYYVSVLALNKIDAMFRAGKIDRKYRRARYHALMLFRMLVSRKERPKHFNSKEMEKYCQNILDALNNEEECEELFKSIVEFIVSKDQDIDISNRKCFEKKETTEYLKSHIDELRNINNINYKK